MVLESLIREKLGKLSLRRIEVDDGNRAAVLVAILERNGQPHFLLTRRTETVATHKGQISFPGGLQENCDPDLKTTALRETEEEIGVCAGEIVLLGEFDEYRAVTELVVRPIVGMIDENAEFRLQAEEVAYLLEVPFDFFRRQEPKITQRCRHGRFHRVYHYDFYGEDIWGLTARIIREFLEFLDSTESG